MGYVEREHSDQSLEEVAEGYVLCLLNRGFFCCNDRDGYKCPDFFRMPNLMHDLVLSIAGFKYKMVDSNTNEFDERVCHVSFPSTHNSSRKALTSLFKIKQLISFLYPLPSQGLNSMKQVRFFPLNDMSIFRIRSLRALRIRGLGIIELPRLLGKLVHLRYLDFSGSYILKLPNSITQLVNLYSLDLSYCWSLEELPEGISKLVALRHLHLVGCDRLSHMPKGLRRLSALETLGLFVVGKPSNFVTPYGPKAKLACDLADLGCLNNLKGELTIVLVDRSQDIVSEAKAANMDRKEITKFSIEFRECGIEDEMVLENLKPGADLEYLAIKEYGGMTFPCWMREEIHFWLPNLVEIEIVNCKECMYMCSFGKLPHLKSLTLLGLEKVQYIENGTSNIVVLANNHPSGPLFPSLENLTLSDIPRLKEWWSLTESCQDQGQTQLLKWMPSFPKLKYVELDMELVNSLVQVFLRRISSLQSLTVSGTKVVAEQKCTPSNVSAKQRQPVILLKSYLPGIFELSFQNNPMKLIREEFRGMSFLKHLLIYSCKAFEAIPEWIDSLTSLESLFIFYCPMLKSLPNEIMKLSNLKYLILKECSREIAERCQESSGEDWPKIQHYSQHCH